MSRKTDLILLQANIKKNDARALLGRFKTKDLLKKVAVIYKAWAPLEQEEEQTGLLHVYLKLEKPRRLNKKDIRHIERRWLKFSQVTEGFASRLSKVFESPGAASGQVPLFHYVVETTPEKGWLKELGKWYDQEHMPGLAAVPGCIHTVRMLNLDHGPKFLSCYDLVDRSVMGSHAWLEVRNTEWSSRCRPHFTKTKRNMFEVLES
jgi:hypothetical protein